MKKILMTFTAFVLTFCLLLIGTGCSQTVLLSFNNSFNDGEDPTKLVETITYEVKYTDNFGDGLIKRDAEFTDETLEFEFKNGKYVQTLETLSFLPDSIETDIDTEDTKILKLSGKLTIDFVYLDGEEEKTNNDVIESEVYFLLAGKSFAPLYSSVKSKCTIVSVSSEETSVAQNEYSSSVEYDNETYTVNKTANDDQLTDEYEYDFRTVVDNNQLLFILRSLNLQEDQTTEIPFVSPAHGQSKKLTIKNEADISTVVTVSYNGKEAEEETISVKNLCYVVSEIKQQGAPQYAFIQSEESDNFGNRAIPLVYAETLTTYGSFMSMGALVYTVSSITVNNG